MKAKIADVVVRIREVEIPEVCPGCGADLTQPGSLFLVLLEHSCYEGKLGAAGIELEGNSVDSYAVGEATTAFTYCSCLTCAGEDEGILAEGKEEIITPCSDEQIEKTIWSACLDKVVFESD